MKNLLVRLGPKAPRYYVQIMAFILIVTYMITPALAVEDMWTAANRIIVDVYNKIAGISTVLAGLMSAVAVIGAKVSNNQHKTDQAWDWLKRIWIAWAIINGMGAFLAYVRPLFDGLATIQYIGSVGDAHRRRHGGLGEGGGRQQKRAQQQGKSFHGESCIGSRFKGMFLFSFIQFFVLLIRKEIKYTMKRKFFRCF